MTEKKISDASILIVDDENFSRISIVRILKKIGDPKVSIAVNGEDALSILKNTYIDCVVLDFNMPVMHGLQLLKKIRIGRHNISRDLPVIMLTAHGDTELVQLAVELDVNSFLLKPATQNSLSERIAKMLMLDSKTESWLKPARYYAGIDVDKSIPELLHQYARRPERVDEEQHIKSVEAVFRPIDSIKENSILSKPCTGNNGNIILKAGTLLTANVLEKLNELSEIGIVGEKVWIRKTQ